MASWALLDVMDVRCCPIIKASQEDDDCFNYTVLSIDWIAIVPSGDRTMAGKIFMTLDFWMRCGMLSRVTQHVLCRVTGKDQKRLRGAFRRMRLALEIFIGIDLDKERYSSHKESRTNLARSVFCLRSATRAALAR